MHVIYEQVGECLFIKNIVIIILLLAPIHLYGNLFLIGDLSVFTEDCL